MDLDMLNDQQKQCVKYLDGQILILSGAGTGKTRVITHRFIEMVKNNVSPYKILCVTFSNKAANELMQRISTELIKVNSNINLGQLWIGTFHKICFKLLQIHGVVNAKTTIIDETDQKKITDKLGIEKFLQDIQKIKESMPINKTDEFIEAFAKYTAFLQDNNLLDFGDIIIKTFELIKNNMEAKQYVQEKFEYIMIDEYQDTSKLHKQLIVLMLNDKQNICCVGDDDQSIYKWRGTDIRNIVYFNLDFPDAKVFRLEHNYRCSIPIVSVAKNIINQNQERLSKEIWSDTEGPKVNICCTQIEGKFIASTIKHLNKNSKIGILVRSGKLIGPIEEALIYEGIPYKIFGGMRFFERAEIKSIVAYLKAIFNDDILSMEYMLGVPKRGIGPKKIEFIQEQIKNGYSLSETLEYIKQPELAELLIRWKNLENSELDLSPGEITRIIIQESGLLDLFEARKDNFEILINKIEAFEDIASFLNNFFTIDIDDSMPLVSIMTVHASKGLEFDTVFVPGLIEGIFPNYKSIQEGNIEEERRLFYVAVTRAKQNLYLSYNLSLSGRTSVFGLSRFLFNLPKEHINFDIY